MISNCSFINSSNVFPIRNKTSRSQAKTPYAKRYNTRPIWTPEQLAQLVEGVHKCPGEWVKISHDYLKKAFTSEQCRQKAMHHQDLGLKRGEWSQEEIELLVKVYQEHPKRWELIRRDYFHYTRAYRSIRNKAIELGLFDPNLKKPRSTFSLQEEDKSDLTNPLAEPENVHFEIEELSEDPKTPLSNPVGREDRSEVDAPVSNHSSPATTDGSEVNQNEAEGSSVPSSPQVAELFPEISNFLSLTDEEYRENQALIQEFVLKRSFGSENAPLS